MLFEELAKDEAFARDDAHVSVYLDIANNLLLLLPKIINTFLILAIKAAFV